MGARSHEIQMSTGSSSCHHAVLITEIDFFQESKLGNEI
jgi:hypothetical protein